MGGISISIAIESGEKETVRLKPSSYVFKVKLIDLPNELIEVIRCVSNRCKTIAYDVTDQYGVIVFEDTIPNTLSSITYRFRVDGRLYGELTVIPIIIDANEIIDRTIDILSRLLVRG